MGGSKMLSFGEAMIRFLPQEDLADPMPPSAAQQFLRCARRAAPLRTWAQLGPMPARCSDTHHARPRAARSAATR
jgi:hypothetical protein